METMGNFANIFEYNSCFGSAEKRAERSEVGHSLNRNSGDAWLLFGFTCPQPKLWFSQLGPYSVKVPNIQCYSVPVLWAGEFIFQSFG